MTNGGVNVKRLPQKPLNKHPSGKVPVFCYGTLLLPALQKKLFGQHIHPRPATLVGWQRLLSPDGYWFITPHSTARVKGSILWLTASQLAICDDWEDVPYYQRECVRVKRGYTRITVFAYTRRGAKGKRLTTSGLTRHSLPRVLNIADRAFNTNSNPLAMSPGPVTI